MVANGLSDDEAFFHESIERLAGGLGVTFEGLSIDWIAGTDPVAGPPDGAQILTAAGWKPLLHDSDRAQAVSRRAASDSDPTDREAKAK